MTRTYQFDVALSFSGEQRSYVREVADALRQGGLSVFFDEFQEATLWGKDLYSHLTDVYQNQARFVVLFISSTYALKAWPSLERASAQARALREKGEYILPARFDGTVIPGLLDTIKYIDLTRLSPKAMANLIIEKIQPQGSTSAIPDSVPEVVVERPFQIDAKGEIIGLVVNGTSRGEIANGSNLTLQLRTGLHLFQITHNYTSFIVTRGYFNGPQDYAVKSQKIEIDLEPRAYRFVCGFQSFQRWRPWGHTTPKLFLELVA